MSKLKPAIPIALVVAVVFWIAIFAVMACGVTSSVEDAVVESGEETAAEPEPELPPCAIGANNHKVGVSYCVCDEGYEWCDLEPGSLDCCAA